MQGNSKIQVQAKTLDKAIDEASQQLGVSKDQINYEIISQANGGFLSFLGSRRVEISAWSRSSDKPQNGGRRSSRSPRRQPQARQAQTPSEPLPPLTTEEMKNLIDDLCGFCSKICQHIVGHAVSVKADVDETRLILDIDDEEMGHQLLDNPKLAESMEHILRKKPRHLKRELPFRIFVDAGGLRIKREVELIDMAQDLSSQVHENQKPMVLNYKSSYDRKIIHMALDKDDKVYTKSIGSGANRKLMILPSSRQENQGANA